MSKKLSKHEYLHCQIYLGQPHLFVTNLETQYFKTTDTQSVLLVVLVHALDPNRLISCSTQLLWYQICVLAVFVQESQQLYLLDFHNVQPSQIPDLCSPPSYHDLCTAHLWHLFICQSILK